MYLYGSSYSQEVVTFIHNFVYQLLCTQLQDQSQKKQLAISHFLANFNIYARTYMADQNQFLSPKFTVHFNEMTIITYKNRHLQKMANQFLILFSTTADWYSYNMNIIHQVQAGVVLSQKLDEMHNKAWSMQYVCILQSLNYTFLTIQYV